MTENAMPQPTVIRTSRGLSIAGRRLTLYSIMDYLQAGWSSHLIRAKLQAAKARFGMA